MIASKKNAKWHNKFLHRGTTRLIVCPPKVSIFTTIAPKNFPQKCDFYGAII